MAASPAAPRPPPLRSPFIHCNTTGWAVPRRRFGEAYGYGGRIDELYAREVGPRLGPGEHYLDFTGSGLYLSSQIEALARVGWCAALHDDCTWASLSDGANCRHRERAAGRRGCATGEGTAQAVGWG